MRTIVAVIVALAAVLAGCGGESPSPPGTGQGSAADAVPPTDREPPAGDERPTEVPPEEPAEAPGRDPAEGAGEGPPEGAVEPPEADTPLARSVVALDPGHNGGNAGAPDTIGRPVDAGGFEKPCNTTGTATADGYPEHRFNLELAELLRQQLEERGATVEMTRTSDDGVGPCIDERGRFAAEVGADVLVSVHADGGPEQGSGFHVIHPAPARSVATDEVVERSSRLAVQLRDELVAAGFAPADYTATDGLSLRDDLGTLNLASVPAVLLEAGNLRNRDDAALLTSDVGQARLADAVVAALEASFGSSGGG